MNTAKHEIIKAYDISSSHVNYMANDTAANFQQNHCTSDSLVTTTFDSLVSLRQFWRQNTWSRITNLQF